ncbi:MAG: DOMON domain-containing protein [Desulfobacteraceae bacterium]|nr:MAG: DOMON domain-containing protein [Desulfobacteraceae bacterium]
MKKSLIIAVLIVLSLAFSTMAMARDYAHSLKAENMDFSWSLDGDMIHVMVSAKTTGWVGIGFNPSAAMKDANIIIGMAKGEKVKIEDHYGNKKRSHVNDKKDGGTNDLKDLSGYERDGVTTLIFSIPLDSGDKYDAPIKADGTDKVILAYGAGRDSLKTRHAYRTTLEVDLKSGKHSEVK